MDLWMAHFENLLIWMLGSPSTQLEVVALSVAGILTFLLILTKVGDLLGAGISSAGRSCAVLVFTLAAWFALTAAGEIYGAPKMAHELVHWIPIASAVLVVLVISVPLTRLFQNAKYRKGLLLIVLSIAASLAVILLVGAAFGAAREGGKEGGKIKARTTEVDDFLSK